MRRYFYSERLLLLASVRGTLTMQIRGLIRPAAIVVLWFAAVLGLSYAAFPQSDVLELSRAARPWEFLCATGQRAGLFGNEAGAMEAWVYPLKIFRNFH